MLLEKLRPQFPRWSGGDDLRRWSLNGFYARKRLDDAFLCPDFVFMQGVQIGRPSLILCRTIDEINVLGR